MLQLQLIMFHTLFLKNVILIHQPALIQIIAQQAHANQLEDHNWYLNTLIQNLTAVLLLVRLGIKDVMQTQF